MIYVNGEPTAVPAGATVVDILARLQIDPQRRGIAVAVDAEIVPRGSWDDRRVPDRARVEIVGAIQGG